MKVNKHGLKMNGLKQTAGYTKDLRKMDRGFYYEIFYSLETGKVWADLIYSIGHNSWHEYRDPTIICIGDTDIPLTMQDIADMIAHQVNMNWDR